MDLKQLLADGYTELIFSAESLKLNYRERGGIIGSHINITSERLNFIFKAAIDWLVLRRVRFYVPEVYIPANIKCLCLHHLHKCLKLLWVTVNWRWIMSQWWCECCALQRYFRACEVEGRAEGEQMCAPVSIWIWHLMDSDFSTHLPDNQCCSVWMVFALYPTPKALVTDEKPPKMT